MKSHELGIDDLVCKINRVPFGFSLLLLTLIIISGCSRYSDISGKVVDGATGKPIEGALVVAQWTKTRGFPGLQHHDLHNIAETLTDKNGAFFLVGTSGFLIRPPQMIIYKEGYIPWRNDMIFPSCNIVKSNEWFSNMTYKLEVFTREYSLNQLSQFLNSSIIGLGDAPMYQRVYYDIDYRLINNK